MDAAYPVSVYRLIFILHYAFHTTAIWRDFHNDQCKCNIDRRRGAIIKGISKEKHFTKGFGKKGHLGQIKKKFQISVVVLNSQRNNKINNLTFFSFLYISCFQLLLSWIRQPRFESQLSHYLWLWAIYFTSISLSLVICKIKDNCR